jgi:microsomal dipeptidase-like Zn-dependent dipeptidase
MEWQMADNTEWEARAKGILKAELKRKGVTYAQLVEKLAKIGVVDSEPNIRNKLARGKFTAVFFLQCLEAIGTSSLHLSDG